VLVLTLLIYVALTLIVSYPLKLFLPSIAGLQPLLSAICCAVLALGLCLVMLRLVRPFCRKQAPQIRDAVKIDGVRWLAFLTAIALTGTIVYDLFASRSLLKLDSLSLLIPIIAVSALNALRIELPLPFIQNLNLPQQIVPIPTPVEPARVTSPATSSVPAPTSESGVIAKTIMWEHEGKQHSLKIDIDAQRYRDLRCRERVLDYRLWANEYVVGGITPELHEIIGQLLKMGRPFGTFDEVSFVLSFVQRIVKYTAIVDEAGDCEDSSILGAALLRLMDYDVALLALPGHMALGVAGAKGLPGSYVSHEKTNYYYCEMTATGWQIGQIPEGTAQSEIGVFTVHLVPKQVVAPEKKV
jgi:hypothetical protein